MDSLNLSRPKGALGVEFHVPLRLGGMKVSTLEKAFISFHVQILKTIDALSARETL